MKIKFGPEQLNVATDDKCDDMPVGEYVLDTYTPRKVISNYKYYTKIENDNLYCVRASMTLDVVEGTALAQAWCDLLENAKWVSQGDDKGYFTSLTQNYIGQVANSLTPKCVHRRFYLQQARLVLEYMLHYCYSRNLSPLSKYVRCAEYLDVLEQFRQTIVINPCVGLDNNKSIKIFNTTLHEQYAAIPTDAEDIDACFQGKHEDTVTALLVRLSTMGDCPWEQEVEKPCSVAMDFVQKIMDDVMQTMFDFPMCIKCKMNY